MILSQEYILIQNGKKKATVLNGGFLFCGAGDRTRTDTVLQPRDFKSLASAYSATSAQFPEP